MNFAWLIDSHTGRLAGETLAHSLWQIAAIAAALALIIRAARPSPRGRYALAALALLLCVTGPVATFVSLFSRHAPQSLTARGPISDSRFDPAGASASQPSDLNADAEVVAGKHARASTDSAVEAPSRSAMVLQWSRHRLGWLAAAWLIGAGLVGLWRLNGYVALHRKRRGLAPAPSPWPGRLQAMRRRLGLRRRAELLVDTSDALGPAVFGLLSPAIVLPLHILTQWPVVQVEAVLAHELAHVRRWDTLAVAVQAAARSLLFHHPGAWWISRQMDSAREELCDDLALTINDNNRTALAQALLAAARGPARPQVTLAASRRSLRPRIQRILTGVPMRNDVSTPRLLACILLPAILAAILAGIACVQADDAPLAATSTRSYDLSGLGKANAFAASALWTRPDGTDAADAPTDEPRLEILLAGLEGPRPQARSTDQGVWAISATGDQHEALRARLTKLAGQPARTLQMQCHVLIVPADSDAAIRNNLDLGDQDTFISASEVDKLSKALSGDPKLENLTAPALMAHPMQTASISVGRQQAVSLPDDDGRPRAFLFNGGTTIGLLGAWEADPSTLTLWLAPRVARDEFARAPGRYARARAARVVTLAEGATAALRIPAEVFRAERGTKVNGQWKPDVEKLGDADWVAWLLVKAAAAPARANATEE